MATLQKGVDLKKTKPYPSGSQASSFSQLSALEVRKPWKALSSSQVCFEQSSATAQAAECEQVPVLSVRCGLDNFPGAAKHFFWGEETKNWLIFSRQNNSSNFNNFLLLYWNSFAPKPAPAMTPVIAAGFSGGENIPFPFCFLFSQMLAIFLCFLQTPAHLCVIGKLGWTQQLPNFSIKLSRSPPKTGCASLQHLFCYPLTFCLHITSPETLSSHFLPPSFPTTHCILFCWLWNHPFSLTK